MSDFPQFRHACMDDAEAIVDLVESGYRGERSRQGWTTEADFLQGQRTDLQSVQALIRQAGSTVLLAEQAGLLLACAHLQRHEGYAYFGMFSVRPECQNAGMGRKMLSEAERFAATEWGVGEMRMTVIDIRHELMAWYERRGYQRTGDYQPFPYGDERFGVPLRDDLRFEVMRKSL